MLSTLTPIDFEVSPNTFIILNEKIKMSENNKMIKDIVDEISNQLNQMY